ncbi:MAG: hypothetical protein OEZ34_15585, partial [Spirochaetia bacterium]|nr:hypothetical protein [Spirochaetia bacterium]
ISFKKDKGSLKLSENSLKRINELALESIKGSWICIDKDILNEDSSLFVFQFMNSEVYEKDDGESIAIVVDYFDNGAQGILVTKTNDGIEVMVPFIDEFVTFNKAEKKMLIPSFRQFIQS